MTAPSMTQTAPYPDELADLVDHAQLWPGWHVWLEDLIRDPASSHGAEGRGLTLVIQTKGYDTYHPRPRPGLPGPALLHRPRRHLQPPLLAPLAFRPVREGVAP